MLIRSRLRVVVWILLTAVSIAETSAQDAEFLPLGDLPGGYFESEAQAVSDDGQTVVGLGKDANVNTRTGFLWTSGSGLTAFGDTSGGNTAFVPQDRAMSPDGKVVAGRIRTISDGSDMAFRWSEETGFVELGDFPGGGTDSVGLGLSADGEVIVGWGTYEEFVPRAFRWTEQTGLIDMGTLAGYEESGAQGISGDGQVIVGRAASRRLSEPFRWTEEDGMVGLGGLAVGETGGSASDASWNGSVIVGTSVSDRLPDGEAFRWTLQGGMVDLGEYPVEILSSVGEAVSNDGQVIGGYWRVDNPETFTGFDKVAFVWTPDTGPLNLRTVLIEGGAEGLDGWRLETASDVSGNGQWVVGQGVNPQGDHEAFLARLGADVVPRFEINPGLNDAWFNAATAGQGFFIIVFPDAGIVFLAWFTFDIERPPEDVLALLGEPGHRWLTAQGPFDGDTANLTVYLTEGGVFDMAEPPAVTDTENPIGTITIVWHDCKNATLTYDIDPPGVSGEIPIARIVPDNVALCEALQ